MSQFSLHNCLKCYPDPVKFIPERWTKEFLFNLPRFAYIQFGGGIRYCIRETFAAQEDVLLIRLT